MLADMLEVFGDREVCVAREMTKLHEEYVFGQLSTAAGQVKPLGEFVVVVEGAREIKSTGANDERRSPGEAGNDEEPAVRVVLQKIGERRLS